jgi:hypothetical protein
MLTFLKLLAAAVMTVIWHFLFGFGWWQSLFLGWLSFMMIACLSQIQIDLGKIKEHLDID